ncbi:MAG: S-layer homology domain-containing protein, partial [Ruminococcaceae bacterium]|nr:S-layer homology domain-containing protein [Oscillospiraceae bacterium]
NPSQNGSGGFGGRSSGATVPVTGSAGSVDLGVKVSNGTAALDSLSDADVAKLVGTDGGNSNVVMDLSGLGDKVETVSLPAASAAKLSNALEAHEGNDSLTIKTANGAVKLNENALSAAANAGSAGSVALTVKQDAANTLSASERVALGGKTAEAVYTLGLASNGRDVGALGGGFAAAELPFAADAEKDALGYRVYRLNDDGTATLVPSAVHDGVVTVRSDRFAKLAVVYEPLTERFDDVSADAYYGDAVLWAMANGITNGMGDGRFAPDEPCSRAQIVTFLWRAAGCPKPKHPTSSFTDVPDDAWYSEAVAWAVENGIIKGMGDGRFGVDEACTRAHVMTMLYRMDGGETAASAAFTDVASGQWYSAAIAWAAANGITNGVGNGRFGVDEPCTRGQIVTMLYRWFAR